jgi:hypothetical protein
MDGELPLAQVRSTQVAGRLAATRGDLSRWLGARARWLVPRVVPLALAGVGLVAILSFTWALAGAAMSAYPPRVDRPTVIYLVRIRPPSTSTTALGAAMTALRSAPVAMPAPGESIIVVLPRDSTRTSDR